VFLNYTGVVKILKKEEKVTGLDIREPYLYRISMLPFSKSVSVAELKTQLLAELSAWAGPAAEVGRCRPRDPRLDGRRGPQLPGAAAEACEDRGARGGAGVARDDSQRRTTPPTSGTVPIFRPNSTLSRHEGSAVRAPRARRFGQRLFGHL
jgi:hypothetical protein